MAQETVQHAGRVWVETGGGQGPPDEDGRAVSYHARDTFFAERLSAELDDQGVGRVGEVAAGIDKGSVEIENDKVDQNQTLLRWQSRDHTMGLG